MAGIKDAITSLMAKIATDTTYKMVRVWNNQLQFLESQQIESIPFPCAFVEVLMPNNYTQLALGITESDITFRVHIGQVEYDAGDGTMEQNLSIFGLRDAMIGNLTYFEPTACSHLMKVAENQDYSHTDVYHYTIDFICSFIDDKGDETRGQTTAGPPTLLETDITIL